jgi:thymidylate kinase
LTASNIFKTIVDHLNQQNIKYCLLRTDETDPFTEDELDILVHKDDVQMLDHVLTGAGFVLWKSRAILKKKVYAFFADNKLFLVDVHFALIQNGIEYLSLDGIFDRRIRKDEFFILSNEDRFLHYFYHNFLGKSHFQPKHLSTIKELLDANLNWDELYERINNPKVKNIFDQFVKNPTSFSEKNNYVEKLCDDIRSSFLTNFSNRFRVWYQQKMIKRFNRTKGVHFAFMGVDGAGKSSLIETLDKRFEKLKGVKHNVVYMGPWGHSISSWHKWVLQKQISLPSENGKKSFFKKFKQQFKGLIYYGSIFFELWYRYLKKVRPALNKGHVILSDRYVYDLRYIYKKRAVKGFRFARYFICRFFPKPDNVIFLYNDPEVIVERKPQLDAQSIKMFQDYYHETLKNYPHQQILTDCSPEILADKTLNKIMSLLLERVK